MGLCEPLRMSIREAQYTEPTEIQQKAIPVALSGRDLIGCAQTGSGKTAAFLLPALQRWYLEHENRPQLLVLAPTRELTTQIEVQMRLFSRHLKVKCAAVLGGASMNRQIQALRGGVDLLVATPGRLEDLWQRGCVNMPRIRMVVLDEADRMLDMGFEPQVRRILARISRERQTLLFSATRPRQMELFTAADLAARGLDIPRISHVITYDVPQWAEDYVHRIGRTGRAGRAGVALTLASQAEASYLAAIERLIGETLPAQGEISGFQYKPDFSQPERNRGADRKAQTALDWLSTRYPASASRAGAVATASPSRRTRR